MNFECHITFDPIYDHEVEDFDATCEFYGFRRAKLYKQNGEQSKKDMFATCRDSDLIRVQDRMNKCIETLCSYGFKIRRSKIEAILIDIRY